MTQARMQDGWILALAGTEARVRGDELAPLLERVARGELDALGPIYDAVAPEIYAAALWRTGSPADAADVVQNVFVKIAATPASLAGVRHPRRYLLTMAHRATIDRARARRPDRAIEEVALLVAPGVEPDRSLDAARATAALRELPRAQRETIYLHHFAGLTFRDVGRVTGVPTFTAASRYRLGIARLRALLGEQR